MKITEIERRAFLADPELRLIDIPDQAALTSKGATYSHDEIADAVAESRREYRSQKPRRCAAADALKMTEA